MASSEERQHLLRMFSDERQQVLRMVEQGTITADEGARLLTALGGDEETSGRSRAPSGRSAPTAATAEAVAASSASPSDELQVRIALATADGHLVTLVLPLQLARFALPLFDLPAAAVLGEHGVDINRIREALRAGEPCEVLDYKDEESGHRVQIVIS